MPRSILDDPRYLPTLTWAEIEDITLGRLGRELASGGIFEAGCLDEFFVRRSERELLGCRSRNELLNIASLIFKLQFRFQKHDFEELCSALAVPETLTNAQGVQVPGRVALCIGLRRLAYPKRWCDSDTVFGRQTSVISSVTSQLFDYIVQKLDHLLSDVNNHSWLSAETMEQFSQAVPNKGAGLNNCWAFIDGTVRPISRPKRNQREYFSGQKRVHVLKYQSIIWANGIVCGLDGPYPGRRHDAGILRDSAKG